MFRLKISKCCCNCREIFLEVNGLVKLLFMRFCLLMAFKVILCFLELRLYNCTSDLNLEVSVMEQAVLGIP